MDKKKIIAIIPARSGSKGLPDKNIKCLDGKPLLAYSVEAARDAGVFDVIHVSTDSQKYSDIAKEFYVIMKGLENNMTLESLLLDFAERCEVEEIVDFTDIFIVGKRSGGNLRELITNCCNTISEQVQMQREFRIQLSSKQFELRIMGVVPFGIILYIGTSSKGYFDSLYHQMPGIGIMTACLTVYAAAFLWGRKIIENTENK